MAKKGKKISFLRRTSVSFWIVFLVTYIIFWPFALFESNGNMNNAFGWFVSGWGSAPHPTSLNVMVLFLAGAVAFVAALGKVVFWDSRHKNRF